MLEAYLRTLWAFIQAARSGAMATLSHEETTVFSLRLSLSGTWEITMMPPGRVVSPTTDLTIPLVLPLVPIILAAHVETQWAQNQRITNVPVLLSTRNAQPDAQRRTQTCG